VNRGFRGFDGQIAHGDTFHNERFPDLKADFILANPTQTLAQGPSEK